jgi:probable HAF family extracellular repeat protein
VGYRKPYGEPTRAFLYRVGRVPINLGTLGGRSVAWGLNGKGQVVGESYKTSDGEYHAFIYKNLEIFDLNDLISDWGNWDSNGYLRSARDINEDGQIVGYGYTYGGKLRAFRLDPIMTPTP